VGLGAGVGAASERNTGPSSGDGSGEGTGLAGTSVTCTARSLLWLVGVVGEVAGRMMIRGVEEESGEPLLSEGDAVDSAE
jgi:hypothetical protein